MNSTTSPLEAYKDEVKSLLEQNLTPAEIAVALMNAHEGFATSDRSIRRALRRWGLDDARPKTQPQAERSGKHIDGDEGYIITPPNPRAWGDKLNAMDDMLRERDLDPDDWEVTNVVVNEWDSPTGETMKQLKIFLKRKKQISMIVPARVSLDYTRALVAWPPRKAGDGPELVVLCGDQQAPYHNKRLHSLFCEFLAETRPHRGVLLGDTIDLPTISRHPDDPAWAATTQECLDVAGQILLDYTLSSERTEWVKLPGNHDERLRRAVIDRLADWYDLRPAQVEGLADLPPIHDPVHLLRLDELGIEYIRANGSYDHAQHVLSPHLAVRHGWLTRKSSGQAAYATLDHLGHSIVVGHTHKQSRVHQTKFDITGKASTLTAVETGCMCRIEEGLGYAIAPDWQQGFATASIWPDGTFSIDLATYVDGILYWRDKRYQ